MRLAHKPEYVDFLKNLDSAIRGAAAGHGATSMMGTEGGGGGRGGNGVFAEALSGMLSPKVPLTPAVQRGLMQFQVRLRCCVAALLSSYCAGTKESHSRSRSLARHRRART